MSPPGQCERVLVTVKTYPTLSKKYGETVCTAGVRPDGSWIRIYPVPFRRLSETEQYSKYDWLECEFDRSNSDPRPESFHPRDARQLHPVSHMNTADGWRERRKLLIETATVHHSLRLLIEGAKANELSLAVVKPTRILDFVWEAEEREWNPDRLREMRESSDQMEIFSDDSWRETFRVIPKLPYSFSYRFEDVEGRVSKLQVLDWETGALYWNCLKSVDSDEPAALAKVRQKYMDGFATKDLHFFLGTTQQFHFVAPNPWVIVGVLPLPYVRQLPLSL